VIYQLGGASESRLVGVLEPLVRVVRRAIVISQIDFGITEGLRQKIRQAALVASGASRTMDGRHLTGHAIDFAAYVGGKISWDWPPYPLIAAAFRTAAIEQGVPIVWGGVWDRLLNDIHGDLDFEAKAYRVRWYKARPNAGPDEGPLIDGPHVELSRKAFPAGVTSTPALPGGAA
jgi:peptidoglycan L-alanyl-D-glutamate endopeptidase CwlK